MVAPALACYALFVVYPVLRGLLTSFTDSLGFGAARWVGLDNYRRLMADGDARAALMNTLAYTVVVVVVQNVLAIFFASVLYSRPRVRNFARVGLLLPSMLSVVVVGYVWSFIYSPLGGPLNTILEGVGLGSLQHVWLGDPATALMAIAAVNIWMFTGYSTVIYLSNFLAIPEETFEAAAVDGAHGWRRFRLIDIHLLAPSITINVALSTIGSLKVFDLPFVMTEGGPANATETFTLIIFENAFGRYEFGYATAIAVVLLALTIVVSAVQVSVLRRREALL